MAKNLTLMQTVYNKINFLLQGFGFECMQDFGKSTFGYIMQFKVLTVMSVLGGVIASISQSAFGLDWQFMLAYTVLIAYEWWTGVQASKSRLERHESRKQGRMLVKISVYTVMIYVLNTIQKHSSFPVIFNFEIDPFYFLYWIFLILVIWQLVVSVMENLTQLGFKWAEKFIVIVNKKFYKHLDINPDE